MRSIEWLRCRPWVTLTTPNCHISGTTKAIDFKFCTLPSMLWRCWLGGRKGIWPVKNWVVGCWHGYLSGVRCTFGIWPSWCHCHSLSIASVISRLVLVPAHLV